MHSSSKDCVHNPSSSDRSLYITIIRPSDDNTRFDRLRDFLSILEWSYTPSLSELSPSILLDTNQGGLMTIQLQVFGNLNSVILFQKNCYFDRSNSMASILRYSRRAALMLQVLTASGLLSMATILLFLNCLAKRKERMPLPQPRSRTLRSPLLVMAVIACWQCWRYFSEVGIQTLPWGQIFSPRTSTLTPFFSYSLRVFQARISMNGLYFRMCLCFLPSRQPTKYSLCLISDFIFRQRLKISFALLQFLQAFSQFDSSSLTTAEYFSRLFTSGISDGNRWMPSFLSTAAGVEQSCSQIKLA